MRKTIGTRLQQSYQQVPHITFDADVDVSAAEALRARANAKLKEGQAKISLTAIVAKACAWALQRHPMVNSRLDEAAGHIILSDEVNIGIAVALDGSPTGGLIVPVVRNTQAKGVQQIANEIADLGARAKANKLKQDEISGGTFSISNLGMYSVDRFTAIINPPEAAILAVGRSKMSFVPDENGQPIVKPIMTIRLSADHRVIDGAVAAQFLSDVRAAIEAPAVMTL
jgi:pyruvate dehydrogenase E2 component (dihydrolipoamide acetyltransferase)